MSKENSHKQIKFCAIEIIRFGKHLSDFGSNSPLYEKALSYALHNFEDIWKNEDKPEWLKKIYELKQQI